ncbi:MAG: AbrB/MazE/SpoVT family DNA-binding domain-containing protein [Caulobacter sp.]|nr:AbrB/MazE/SpoVT family DNA-binding domain-containing protein [Caulobacter sp.]
MFALKLTRIGNSVGVVLPKEALAKLGVEKGDVVYLTDAPDSAMTLSAYDPKVARQLALGEEVMDEFRDTFRALAK